MPEQDLLMPPSLREWLPKDHLAFFVSDLIDQLDLSAITSAYEAEERGYPPYHPVMLTKLFVYAYCVGVLGPCPRGPLPKTATIIDRMARKLHTKAGAAVYAARKGIVEPVIGQIKQARGFRQFLLRGREKRKVSGRWCARPTTS